MKADMRRYGIGVEDPKRFSNVLQVLQRDNYDCTKILGVFSSVSGVFYRRASPLVPYGQDSSL
jgi:hypothetical protein